MICRNLLKHEETFELGLNFIEKDDIYKIDNISSDHNEYLFICTTEYGFAVRYVRVQEDKTISYAHWLKFERILGKPYNYELQKVFIKYPGRESYFMRI